MISLHVSIYNLDDEKGDRFKVMGSSPDNPDEMVDITEHYEVAGITTEDGRAGFAVVPIPAPPEGPPNRLIKESEGG